MKYEVILLDADDTLFDFKKAEKVAFIKALDEFNVNYDRKECMEIYTVINRNIWKEFEGGLISSSELKVERFKRLFEKINLSHDAKEFSISYMRHLSEASFIFEETVEVLEHLKDKYRLAIITNGLAEVQHNRIRNSEVAHYFETVVISDEIKIAKPSKEIFDYTLKEINYEDRSKILMVGDSLTSDIQGGINAGIDTCWFNIRGIENTTSINATLEIKSILELKEIL